jgi:hypothetical protein
VSFRRTRTDEVKTERSIIVVRKWLPRCSSSHSHRMTPRLSPGSSRRYAITCVRSPLAQQHRADTNRLGKWGSQLLECNGLVLKPASGVDHRGQVPYRADGRLVDGRRVRETLRASLSDRQRRILMHDRHVLLHRQTELSAKDQMILES